MGNGCHPWHCHRSWSNILWYLPLLMFYMVVCNKKQMSVNVLFHWLVWACLSALRPVSKPFMSPSEQAQTVALLCVRHVQPWFAIHAFLSSTVVFTRLSIQHPLKTAREDPTMAPSTSLRATKAPPTQNSTQKSNRGTKHLPYEK